MLNLRGDGFRSKYLVKDILSKLRENKLLHGNDYTQAMKEYKKQLVAVLETKLAAAKEGRNVSHNIGLSRPVEFLDEYQQAIKMLEMTSETTIELDVVLFKQLVLDDWSWKDQFTSHTSSYISKDSKDDDDAGV